MLNKISLSLEKNIMLIFNLRPDIWYENKILYKCVKCLYNEIECIMCWGFKKKKV